MYPLIGTLLLESTDYHFKTIYHSALGNVMVIRLGFIINKISQNEWLQITIECYSVWRIVYSCLHPTAFSQHVSSIFSNFILVFSVHKSRFITLEMWLQKGCQLIAMCDL